MPTITIPVTPWAEIPKLSKSKRFRELAAEKVVLKQQADRIKLRMDGDEETGTLGLSQELYLLLDQLLPDDVKSIDFEGYMLTKIDAGTSSKFNKSELMKRPLPCTGCEQCRKKKAVVFVTVADIEACTTEGTRKPTVSAEKIEDKTKTKTKKQEKSQR